MTKVIILAPKPLKRTYIYDFFAFFKFLSIFDPTNQIFLPLRVFDFY